jgi:tetratricopeptide (TPR) repeat protein
MSVAWEAWFACRGADTITACEQALAHLAQADGPQSRIARVARIRLGVAYIYAPLPVDEALRRIRALVAEHRHPLETAAQRTVEGRLLGMQGDTERARELVSGARQLFVEAGLLVTAGGMAGLDSELAFERGDLEQAELILLDGLDLLERIGDRSYYPTLALMLAHVLANQQRFDDVPEWLDRARATTGTDDVINFILVDALDGAVLAHEGRHGEAVAVGRRAVELAEQIDFVWARPLAHSYFAETLALAEKHSEAAEHACKALEILAAKGNVTLVARLRERLAAVGVDV